MQLKPHSTNRSVLKSKKSSVRALKAESVQHESMGCHWFRVDNTWYARRHRPHASRQFGAAGEGTWVAATAAALYRSGAAVQLYLCLALGGGGGMAVSIDRRAGRCATGDRSWLRARPALHCRRRRRSPRGARRSRTTQAPLPALYTHNVRARTPERYVTHLHSQPNDNQNDSTLKNS